MTDRKLLEAAVMPQQIQLRRLVKTTKLIRYQNFGSSRRPDRRPIIEETTEESLQYSNDSGLLWLDVPTEYSFVQLTENL